MRILGVPLTVGGARPLHFLTLAVLLLFSACDAAEPPAPRDLTRSIRSSQPCASVTTEAVPRVALGDAGSRVFFERVVAATAASNHRYYVADAGRHHVLVFDSTGAVIDTIGREGAGPGEFQGIINSLWVHNETLHVSDSRREVSTFDGAGRYIDRVRLGTRGVVRGTVLDTLILLVSSSRFPRDAVVRDTVFVDLFSPRSGQGVRRLFTLPGTERFATVSRGFSVVNMPFASRPSVGLLPGDLLVIGTGDTASVNLVDLKTGAVSRLPVPTESMPVSGAMLDEWRARHPGVADLIEPEEYAEVTAAYQSVVADQAGFLWILPFRESAQDSAEWRVIDLSGRVQEVVRTGPRSSILHAGPRSVLVRAEDSLGVHRVEVFRRRCIDWEEAAGASADRR